MNFTATAFVVGILFGAIGMDWWQGDEADQLKADYAKASQAAIDKAKADFDKEVTRQKAVTENWAKVAKDEQSKTDRLNGDIAAGKFRVYVRATCSSVSKAATNTGTIVEETRPELAGQAYERADRYRAELKQLLIDYSELQDYLLRN
jgi:hypothetical protein